MNELNLYDLTIEECVLGSMITSEDALVEFVNIIKPAYFYKYEHQQIYESIHELYRNNRSVDLISVTSEAKRKKCLMGASEITSLSNRFVLPSQMDDYAKLLAELHMRREVVRNVPKIVYSAQDRQKDVFDILSDGENIINSIRDNAEINEDVHVASAVKRAERDYESAKKSEGFLGIRTGINSLDDITKGFKPKNNVVIAARPGQGKTATLLQIAKFNAIINKIPTAIFSLEMGSEELIKRLAADLASLDFSLLQEGKLSKIEEEKLLFANSQISESPLYIDDTASLSSVDFRGKVKRLKRKYGIKLVLHDFIQLRKGSGKETKEIVSESSRTDKLIAKENDIVVIDLSQLNREVEKRSDKEPQLSDLKETSALEENADIVIFLVRPYYYGIEQDESGESLKNKIKYIVAKNRNGHTGKCWAYWYGNTQSIKNEDRNQSSQFPKLNPFSDYQYTYPQDDITPF